MKNHKSQKPKEEKVCFTCLSCKHSFDYYNIGASGEFIMGKCKYSQYSVLLSQKQCIKFEIKE